MTEVLSSLIGGSWCAGPLVYEDINPARPSEIVAEVAGADESLVEDAIAAAEAAFQAWRTTPAPIRGEILHRIADIIHSRADTIGQDMAREEGKTVSEAVQEAIGAAAQFRYAAGRTMDSDGMTVPSRDRQTPLLLARREPVGVVACITPWNFPMAIPAWKLAHAIAAGNTVVWKPAEITPLTSVHLARCVLDAELPDGVLNMVLGVGAIVGRAIVQSRTIRAISFTGSNAVGREVATRAATLGMRAQLEMGGSNPAVVLADADVDLAAEHIAQGAFLSAGQKCTATSRVIVEEKVFDDLAAGIAERARGWMVGDPLSADTVVGPVASRAQFDRLAFHLSSPPRGAALLAGGPDASRTDNDGFYISPSVYTGVAPDEVLAQGEIFGPIVTLLRARDYAEALQLANATPFGLSASLFTSDLTRAMRFIRDCDAGVVKVNKPTTGNEPHVPFGGHKDSGSGPSEMGWTAQDFFTQWKTAYIGVSDVSD